MRKLRSLWQMVRRTRFASRPGFEYGAAIVEFTFSIALFAVTASAVAHYTEKYLSTNDEAIVRQSLSLGRLAAIPNLVIRDSSGAVISNPQFGELVGLFLRQAFVTNTLVKGTGSNCVLAGDYRSFVLEIIPPGQSNTGFVELRIMKPDPSTANKNPTGVFNCLGEMVPAPGSDPLVPLHIFEMAKSYANKLTKKCQVLVIYSNDYQNIAPYFKDISWRAFTTAAVPPPAYARTAAPASCTGILCNSTSTTNSPDITLRQDKLFFIEAS